MRYCSPTDLPELTRSADRAQAVLDALLTDVEQMPNASIEYRLSILNQVTDFIYRLTAVRKTLIALRASMNPNSHGLRALTATIRDIHDQMVSLQGDIRSDKEFRKERDRLYASPSPLATYGRFAPDWPPATDEIIPEPRIPGRAGSPNPPSNIACGTAALGGDLSTPRSPNPQSSSCGTAIPGCDSGPSNAPCGTAVFGSDLGMPYSPNTASSASRPFSTDNPSSSSIPPISSIASISTIQSTSHDELPSSSRILPPSSFPPPPDRLDALAASINSRIPASISDRDFQLPPSSNRAADYAPLFDLDLVPHTNCIPTLPLAAPDLSDQIEAQLNHIETGCTQLGTSIHNTIVQAGASPMPSDAAAPIAPLTPEPLPAEPENPPPLSTLQPVSNNDLIIPPFHGSATEPESPPPRSHSP